MRKGKKGQVIFESSLQFFRTTSSNSTLSIIVVTFISSSNHIGLFRLYRGLPQKQRTFATQHYHYRLMWALREVEPKLRGIASQIANMWS